jgi:nitrogen-specific signal transduction histidine kinase
MLIQSSLILLFIFDIALIILIYSYNPAGTVNRFLSLLLIPITLTNLAILFLYTGQDKFPVKIGLHIAIWSVIFFFPLFYHFSFYFPRKRITKKTVPTLAALYITPVIIGILNLISIGIETDIPLLSRLIPLTVSSETDSGFYLYHFFMLIYILILLFLTSRRLILSFRLPLLKKERQTIILILTGFIPLSFILLFSYLLFYPLKWGIYLYLIASATYTVFFIFLLFQFGFIERKALVRVFILYPGVIGALFLLFSTFLTGFNQTAMEVLHINEAFVLSVEVLIFIALLSPAIRALEQALENRILPIKQNFHEALKDASFRLVPIISLYELDKFLNRLFLYELRTRQFYFLIKDDQSHKFQTLRRTSNKITPEFSDHGELVRKIKREKRVMDIQQLSLSWSRGTELRTLDYHRIILVIPLFEKNDLVGMCLLGEPGSVQTWHSSEIEALELFASGLAITIARCKMHRQALEMEKRQAKIEKMTVLNELTSGVAHEIRNPMSIISTSAETIASKELSQEETKKLATYIQEETKRMSGLLDKILVSFSPQADLNNTSTDVCSVITHTFELVGSQARKKNLHLEYTFEKQPLYAFIDWAALTQICLNITLNAIEATPENGRIEAAATIKEKMIHIHFINEGAPISEDLSNQIFNPFFTTKENGTGLGLSVSQRLVKEAGGNITLLPDQEHTVFQITLPPASQSGTENETIINIKEHIKNITS